MLSLRAIIVETKTTISSGDKVLGIGTIDHLDPPMGIAFGRFNPSDLYSGSIHANTIDGEYLGDKAATFLAAVDGRPVQTASIAIEDWSTTSGEVHFTIWFKEDKEYRAVFQDHSDFKAYHPDPE